MARDAYMDWVLGSADGDRRASDSEPPRGGNDDRSGYSHWCDPPKSGGTPGLGTLSADKNAFESDKAGMEGTENPYVPYVDRERGDTSAKGRDNRSPGVADRNWFDSQFGGDNGDLSSIQEDK